MLFWIVIFVIAVVVIFWAFEKGLSPILPPVINKILEAAFAVVVILILLGKVFGWGPF